MGFVATNASPDSRETPGPRVEFWRKHPGIVWSNRQADDGVRIRLALMNPIFPILLDIAVEFGLERLEQEWALLQSDVETDTHRVERFVSPILHNIRRGYEQAST